MNRLYTPLWAYTQACIQAGATRDAIPVLKALVAQYPEDAMLRRAYVMTLMEADRYAEALPHLEWLHARTDGKDEQTYHRYALALHFTGQFLRCLEICTQGLEQHPRFSQLYALRGGTWQVFGAYEEMMDDCRKAVALDPDNTHAAYALALRELMVSNLSEGFEGYGERVYEPHEEPLSFFNVPSWEGEDLAGKTLIVVWEQGIGDIIMFAGFVPYLHRLGATIILTAPEKLAALFARSFPGCEVVVVRDEAMEEALEQRADYSVLMGNLIELCLPHYRPAEHPPHLKADHTRAMELRRKYQAHNPGRPYLIGIAWHTTNPQTGMLRNIALEQWQPLFDLPGVQCISLQYDAKQHVLPEAMLVDETINAYTDIDALAAQMAAMDEIITIQNVTAHLAGALGIPTTLLLSSASDWRWGIGEPSNAWYGSVTILRQREPLIWQPVMEEMARRVTARLKQAAH